jgi:hypothetical protein
MRRALFIVIFLFSSCYTFAQPPDLSLSVGTTKAVSINPINDFVHTDGSFCLSASVVALWRKSRNVDLGFSVQYRSYNFLQHRVYASVGSERMQYKASYLCMAPVFDLNLIRRGLLHLYFAVPIGLRLSSSQQETLSDRFGTTEIDGSANVHGIYAGITTGLKQKIPIKSGKWYLVFDENYTFLVCDLSSASRDGGGYSSGIRAGYYGLELGVIRKLK